MNAITRDCIVRRIIVADSVDVIMQRT